MKYHFNLPLKDKDIKKLTIGDIIYISGRIFTARDEAHRIMLEKKKIPFDPSPMALYHCGPLMKREKNKWIPISAGPTTSSRLEMFEDKFIEKFRIKVIIGKGGMGKETQRAMQRYTCIYTSYTGGAGALAADRIEEVENIYWLNELGMAEAVWIFKVKDFGPLIVAMDSQGNSIYEQLTKNREVNEWV